MALDCPIYIEYVPAYNGKILDGFISQSHPWVNFLNAFLWRLFWGLVENCGTCP